MGRFGAIRESVVTVEDATTCFTEWGDPDGAVVVGWPGNPGSRFGLGWARLYASECGVRLFVFDRPGFGRSSPDPSRTVSSTARRICEAVASLGIESFGVLGNSSGGPYALACGAVAPGSVTSIAVIAGGGRMDEAGSHSGMSIENDRFWSLASQGPSTTTPDFEQLLRNAGANAKGLHKERVADIAEAGRQGAEHLALDAHVITARWDFDESDITMPVDLWHGAADDDIPLEQAWRLADRLPRATLHVWPRHGHDMPPEAMTAVYALLR
ncbi:MAG TPA: alpha/beta hydrolase [Candidatus Limnocylindrales bacterium]|nr:alpha/beta hydrolase [Candidatus Limnocylindrales bacterium]